MTTEQDNLATNCSAAAIRDAIDWSVLDAFKALQMPGKPDLGQQLITVYLDSSPPLMDAMRIAVSNGDGNGLMQSAHSLKSSSAGVGATPLSATCAALEQLGRANTPQDAADLLRQAETQFTAVCAAFRQKLEQPE